MTPEEFGIALRIRRTELKMRQEELALVLGTNRRVISELERGKPTVQLQIALAAAQMLGLDMRLEPRGGPGA